MAIAAFVAAVLPHALAGQYETLPGFGLPAVPGRTVAASRAEHAEHLAAAAAGQSPTPGDAPAWPLAFNATMIKLVPALSSPQNFLHPPIVWSRFSYDYTASPGGSARYDFHARYVPLDALGGPGSWAGNCSILFGNFSIWFVFPEARACHLRTDNLPSISPWWLNGIHATLTGPAPFRGMAAQEWTGVDPDNASFPMPYYGWPPHRSAAGTSVPLRTTNQAADPGATDYTDQQVGPQDPAQFAVPEYCHTNQVPTGCPWW